MGDLTALTILTTIFMSLSGLVYRLSTSLEEKFNNSVFDSVSAILDSAILKISINTYFKALRALILKLKEEGIPAEKELAKIFSNKEAVETFLTKIAQGGSMFRFQDQEVYDFQKTFNITLDDTDRDEIFQITESISSLYTLQADISNLTSSTPKVFILGIIFILLALLSQSFYPSWYQALFLASVIATLVLVYNLYRYFHYNDITKEISSSLRNNDIYEVRNILLEYRRR